MFLSGIDIGGTSIKFGIFDEQLNLLQQWSRPTPKEPAEGEGRIKASFSLDKVSIRVLSPKILPFERSLLGSMARTASLCPFLSR